jgi:hypothetical protein
MNKLLALLTFISCFTFEFAAQAEDVNLEPKTVRACIKKSTTIVQSPIQLNEVVINGVTSRSSTFTYRGQIARLTGDVDEANIVAYCLRPGRETFNIEMEQNNPERTRYHVQVTVNCVRCD